MKCNWNLLIASCFKILTLTHNSNPTYTRLSRQNFCLKHCCNWTKLGHTQQDEYLEKDQTPFSFGRVYHCHLVSSMVWDPFLLIICGLFGFFRTGLVNKSENRKWTLMWRIPEGQLSRCDVVREYWCLLCVPSSAAVHLTTIRRESISSLKMFLDFYLKNLDYLYTHVVLRRKQMTLWIHASV